MTAQKGSFFSFNRRKCWLHSEIVPLKFGLPLVASNFSLHQCDQTWDLSLIDFHSLHWPIHSNLFLFFERVDSSHEGRKEYFPYQPRHGLQRHSGAENPRGGLVHSALCVESNAARGGIF